MGIGIGTLKALCREQVARGLSGRVLTLGRMFVYFDESELRAIAAQHGARLHDVPADVPRLSGREDLAAQGYLSDRFVLQALGFAQVEALDFSDYQGAEHLFDLNQAELPAELAEGFDFVFDGGTLEHVFHLPHALNNLFRLLRPGGRIMHMAPSSNHVDHGFYMFSPTFFWDFYSANRFRVETVQLLRYLPDHHAPWTVWDYTPGCLDGELSFGGLDGGMYGVICVVARTPESTGDRVPQQGQCQRDWQGGTSAAGGAAYDAGPRPGEPAPG
ncbi:MAG: class I SAM-dependent methyltransferase, partial [Planctomycetes bacterium]|nr:class I SAM-dependent methyltransferase [Planctomycetota bacterium]